MLDWTEYAKIFLALLVIVNPVGAVPLFVSMTSENNEEEKNGSPGSPALPSPWS